MCTGALQNIRAWDPSNP